MFYIVKRGTEELGRHNDGEEARKLAAKFHADGGPVDLVDSFGNKHDYEAPKPAAKPAPLSGKPA